MLEALAKAGAVTTSTSIDILTDVIGRPFLLNLTPGNVSDVWAAELLLHGLQDAKHFIADKG